MTVKEVIQRLGLSPSDFKTSDNKIFIYEFSDSDEFAHYFNLFDNDDEFEEDLDSQNINLFTNTIVFIDNDGEVDCELMGNFTTDNYRLALTEL